MPDLVSREPWFLNDPIANEGIYFDVPGDIIWTRSYRGRNTLPLCGNNTVTVRGLGKRNVKIQIQVNPGALRNTRKEYIIGLAQSNKQFTLTPPGGEIIPVKFDPAVALEERWQNGRRVLTVGFQEVIEGANSGAPPPALPPFILWANPVDITIPSGPGSALYPVTVAWEGHANYSTSSGIWITNLAHDTFYGDGLIIPKSVAGSIIYSIPSATPPNGTYQWTLRPASGTSFEPIYSVQFTLTRL